MCYRCCACLENEALNKNIGRWETTWFNFHTLIKSVLNFVGYGFHQICRRCRGPIVLFEVKFLVCLCSVCWCLCRSSVVELVYVYYDSVYVCFV